MSLSPRSFLAVKPYGQLTLAPKPVVGSDSGILRYYLWTLAVSTQPLPSFDSTLPFYRAVWDFVSAGFYTRQLPTTSVASPD